MTMRSALEPLRLRRVFGSFPTGVTVVAGVVDGVPAGLAVNSFVSVSLDPPMVSVCAAHTSRTWPILRQAGRIGVSVLGAHQEHVGRQLSAHGVDRFAALRWRSSPDGAVLLDGASAWLDCAVEREIPAGDHDIVLLRVYDLDADPHVAPLVFHGSRYRRLHHGED
jgi:flavin reductase (DIM6/NTAB) family NADH-FMN oxidoreductase RutF